jgi:hypothetical protein
MAGTWKQFKDWSREFGSKPWPIFKCLELKKMNLRKNFLLNLGPQVESPETQTLLNREFDVEAL